MVGTEGVDGAATPAITASNWTWLDRAGSNRCRWRGRPRGTGTRLRRHRPGRPVPAAGCRLSPGRTRYLRTGVTPIRLAHLLELWEALAAAYAAAGRAPCSPPLGRGGTGHRRRASDGSTRSRGPRTARVWPAGFARGPCRWFQRWRSRRPDHPGLRPGLRRIAAERVSVLQPASTAGSPGSSPHQILCGEPGPGPAPAM